MNKVSKAIPTVGWLLVALAGTIGIAGCEGATGQTGKTGKTGQTGDAGPAGKAGLPGEGGASCTVTPTDGGGSLITCPDGTTTTIDPSSSCTVLSQGDTCKKIVCDDGTTETVCAPVDLAGKNLVAVHDVTSKSYDKACLACHLDKLGESSLAATTPGYHKRKMGLNSAGKPIIPGNTPDEKCVFCHRTVDMSPNRSAGNLRRQVDVAFCAGCHTTGKFDFYQP